MITYLFTKIDITLKLFKKIYKYHFYPNERVKLVNLYEASTHQVDGVSACPTQVGHRRALDTSMTRVRHTVLCVPFKKYYFLT